MKRFLLLLSIPFLFAGTISQKIVTEVNFLKLINGDAGLEFLFKTSVKLNDRATLKLGLSEGFTAPRGSIFSFNHAGARADFGVFWTFGDDLMAGYTHSFRKWYEGASPQTVFVYDSVDMISLRKEFNVVF